MTGKAITLMTICGSFFFLGLIAIGLSIWRKKSQARLNGLGIAALGVVLLLGFLGKFFLSQRAHSLLQAIEPEFVSEIRVGDYAIKDSNSISAIVLSLHEAEIFYPEHERPPRLPFAIILNSGETYYLLVKYREIRDRKGFIIEVIPDHYVFSEELFNILVSLGIPAATLDNRP